MTQAKCLLIDGSSLAFRAFYGLSDLNKFKTRTGLHTNALYAFHTMLDSIMKREQPTHVLVAFDAGKTTFRTEKFADYKGGRAKMPVELAEQWPYFKVMLDALGIAHYELANYEADDIIGTLSRQASEHAQVVVISGDRDMLQLAQDKVRIDITQKGAEVKAYTPERIQEEMGITPLQIIDVKGLMGDSSDNYPGVTKVGEKTALKLIQEFASIEGVYAHVDTMKASKLKENLIADKEMAFLSKDLATINCQAPLAIDWQETTYSGKNLQALHDFYTEMEFKQFLNQMDTTQIVKRPTIATAYTWVDTLTSDMFAQSTALYIELLSANYHVGQPFALAWCTDKTCYVTDWQTASQSQVFKNWLADAQYEKFVYDVKRTTIICQRAQLTLAGVAFDSLLAAYLLNTNDSQQELATLLADYSGELVLDEEIYGKGAKQDIPERAIYAQHIANKVQALWQSVQPMKEHLAQANMTQLYYDMELPLAHVLTQMEVTGISVDKQTLVDLGNELEERMVHLEAVIYQQAGETFNIQSPKQLGVILFEKLGLPAGKKTKTGYSTAVDVLEKLQWQAPIVQDILMYRQLSKLKSTYVDGLQKYIAEDGKIHTRYVQTLTQTGRLSSVDPNLQNIPIRMEEGRRIRKAFVPSQDDWVILSADYSQVELRVLAHIAQDTHMQQAFIEDKDIHTTTAMRVFGVSQEDVDSQMRRQAKAVNFGIVYGISDYGLSQNLNITRQAAQQFIDTYLAKYPNIKAYMENIVESAREKGYVETLCQRRRYLPDLSASNFNVRSFAERTAMNTPIQGSAADIIKLAMIQLAQQMAQQNVRARMLLQVHDELIFEVPQDELSHMIHLVKETMETALTLDVPLKVDCQSGATWYDAK